MGHLIGRLVPLEELVLGGREARGSWGELSCELSGICTRGTGRPYGMKRYIILMGRRRLGLGKGYWLIRCMLGRRSFGFGLGGLRVLRHDGVCLELGTKSKEMNDMGQAVK